MADSLVSPFQKCLDDLAESERNIKATRELLRTHKRRLNKVVHLLSGTDHVVIGTSTWGSYITVNATVKDVDGFKCKRLMDVLGRFVDTDDTSTSDYAESLNRTYRFSYRLPDGVSLHVVIDAYAKSDSPTCRKVLVGKKRRVTVEKQYAIECN